MMTVFATNVPKVSTCQPPKNNALIAAMVAVPAKEPTSVVNAVRVSSCSLTVQAAALALLAAKTAMPTRADATNVQMAGHLNSGTANVLSLDKFRNLRHRLKD